MINGVTDIVITKLDVLDTFENIKVAASMVSTGPERRKLLVE